MFSQFSLNMLGDAIRGSSPCPSRPSTHLRQRSQASALYADHSHRGSRRHSTLMSMPTRHSIFNHGPNPGSNPGSGPETPVMVWQYLEDISSALWTPYTEGICHQLTNAVRSGALKCQVTEPVHQHALEIDFVSMIETNVVTGWQRKMRVESVPPPPPLPLSMPKVPKIPKIPKLPLSTPLATPLSSSQPAPEWQWYSDKRGWTAYHSKLSRKMESAFTEGMTRYVFKIRSTRTQYEVDFGSMIQRNLDTLKVRAIRRQLNGAAPNTVPTTRSVPRSATRSATRSAIRSVPRSGTRSTTPSVTPCDPPRTRRVQRSQCLDLPPPPPLPPPLTVPALTAATALPKVDSHFVWEYRTGDGRWCRYEDTISLHIEALYQRIQCRSSGAAADRVQTLKIGGVDFAVSLREEPMVQTNLVTGTRSEIRRVIRSEFRSEIRSDIQRESITSPQSPTANMESMALPERTRSKSSRTMQSTKSMTSQKSRISKKSMKSKKALHRKRRSAMSLDPSMSIFEITDSRGRSPSAVNGHRPRRGRRHVVE